MAEVTSLSSSELDAITRTIDLEEEIPQSLSLEQLEAVYDMARTVKEIERGDYKRIALQFPDELLPHSVPIFRVLKSNISESRELYVLADTSYGSCCVDEVAAQHVNADALVHYGHACMSQTSRLPVIYVFAKRPVDSFHCVDSFLDAASSLPDKRAMVLTYDVAYAHAADSVMSELRRRLARSIRILHTPLQLATYPSSLGQHRTSHHLKEAVHYGVEEPLDSEAFSEETIVLYIGGESLTLTNLLLTHASCEVYSYEAKSRIARLESGRTNKLLMRRYAAVQKARDADVIGILVGTLGVANYLPLIAHLRDIIKRAHRKSYTVNVGKPNPAKLGNFLEIECFVFVACPENSLLDAKEFLRPIVTPYELEIALQPMLSWTGRYVLDFEQLLREHRDAMQNLPVSEHRKEEQDDLDQPVFSLVTGKYRYAKRYGINKTSEDTDVETSAVILRNEENALAKMDDNAAAQFLQSRIFRGLEMRIGQDAPSLLEQGRSGIARGYTDDRHDEDSQ